MPDSHPGDGEDPDLAQVDEIVARLRVVIGDYVASTAGHGAGPPLGAVEIRSALEAALAEADGAPSPAPAGAEPRAFVVHGLYEELVQQPSNVFETRRFPDGTLRWIPLSRDLWKACLHRLRDSLA